MIFEDPRVGFAVSVHQCDVGKPHKRGGRHKEIILRALQLASFSNLKTGNPQVNNSPWTGFDTQGNGGWSLHKRDGKISHGGVWKLSMFKESWFSGLVQVLVSFFSGPLQVPFRSFSEKDPKSTRKGPEGNLTRIWLRGRANREAQTANWEGGGEGAVERGVKSGLKKA